MCGLRGKKNQNLHTTGVNCVTTDCWGSKLTALTVTGAQANKCARGTQPTTAAMIRHGGIENGE